MKHTDEKQKNQIKNKSTEKDTVAAWSFLFGLVSIPFAFVGVIPLAAIILGIWGINRTKIDGSGRWMAIVGLILGSIFLLSNAWMNNHLGFLNFDTEKTTPKLQQTTDLVARLVKMERMSDEKFEVSAEITNISNKPIRALKGTVYIDTIFDEYVTGIDAVRTELLQPGDKFIVHDEVQKLGIIGDETFDGYEDLVEAGSIENLKVKIYIKEIVF